MFLNADWTGPQPPRLEKYQNLPFNGSARSSVRCRAECVPAVWVGPSPRPQQRARDGRCCSQICGRDFLLSLRTGRKTVPSYQGRLSWTRHDISAGESPNIRHFSNGFYLTGFKWNQNGSTACNSHFRGFINTASTFNSHAFICCRLWSVSRSLSFTGLLENVHTESAPPLSGLMKHSCDITLFLFLISHCALGISLFTISSTEAS